MSIEVESMLCSICACKPIHAVIKNCRVYCRDCYKSLGDEAPEPEPPAPTYRDELARDVFRGHLRFLDRLENDASYEVVARACYAAADALLAEGAKQSTPEAGTSNSGDLWGRDGPRDTKHCRVCKRTWKGCECLHNGQPACNGCHHWKSQCTCDGDPT